MEEKYKNNDLVEEMDAIYLLNDNYNHLGLKKNYVGMVVENIKKSKMILVDFFNPFTAKSIKELAEIKYGDYKIVTKSKADQLLVKQYKYLFRNN
ncbi:MAG: hypothetical protein E7378_03575 [Clostridiales bacterium]|nr:hypothetical protein [Clostridiales bacterium]